MINMLVNDVNNSKSPETEVTVPMVGLTKGLWIMAICATAFIGTTFVTIYALLDPNFGSLAKALLGSLTAATFFGTIFGVSRYFMEEQIKYNVMNSILMKK